MKMALITEADIAKIVEDGKKFVEDEDFATAVDHFAKALDDLVPKYGELHQLLGHVYLYYGQALLGFAKDEADALVENMVPKDGNAKEENGENAAADTITEEPEEEKPSEKEEDEKEEEAADKDEESPENGDEESADKAGESEDSEEKEDGENVDNLQVAWEVLELARKIFEAEGESGKEMFVETLYYLGNVSIENENFLAAADDLILCAQEYNIEKGSLRRHAEIHFKLALAYSMSQKFDESIECLDKAKDTLLLRIKQLDESKDEEKKEIGELQEIIKEIDIKKTDVEVYKEEAHKSVLELLKGVTSEMSSGVSQEDKKAESPKKLTPRKAEATSEVVNDISHLVRRKRASEEETDATSPKKPTMSTT